MIRKFAIAVLTAVAVMPLSADPKLSVASATFDAGDVVMNSKIHAAFYIANDGTDTLKILNLRSTCGCTVSRYDPDIAPGDTGTVSPVVDLAGMRVGRMSRSVHITTNDPNARVVTLTVTANVVRE